MAIDGMKTELLARMMDAATLRHEVLSNNLANQNTPGFTRSVVKFESLIRDAITGGNAKTQEVLPTVVPDELTPRGESGNNVNLESELNAIRENQLLFDTYASIMKSNFDILQSSIHSR